mgnify:CR=1 FL=1
MDLTTATHALPPGFPADATLPAVVVELGRRFEAAGHELSLVGGPVRDLFLGRPSPDLDFTTDADPDASEAVGAGWADATWDVGRRFGTIGFRKAGWQLEVTTYRAEQYDPASRKPQVAFGDSLEDDLLRRDFTVNAMALRLPALELVDPFGGMRDLHAGVLRTPGTPEDSFSDDPLRMMRAARFASQLGFAVAPEVEQAMTAMAERIEIVSADHQNKADIASNIARQWYDTEQVDSIMELTTSSVALAVQTLAGERNKVTMVTGGGTTELTGKACTPYSFHWAYDTHALAVGTGGAVVKVGGDSWFFLTADYAFGTALENDTGAVVKADGSCACAACATMRATGFAPFAALILATSFGLASSGAYLLSGAVATVVALLLSHRLEIKNDV